MIQSSYTQIETGVRNIFVSDLLVIVKILDTAFEDAFHGLLPVSKYEPGD